MGEVLEGGDVEGSFNIQSFPTLLVINIDSKGQPQVQEYKGELKFKAMVDYISKFALKEKLKKPENNG